MIRQNVSSSNQRSVGYDPTTNILEIEFHKGGIYQYFHIPVAVYPGLMSAGSKGSYFSDFIKTLLCQNLTISH